MTFLCAARGHPCLRGRLPPPPPPPLPLPLPWGRRRNGSKTEPVSDTGGQYILWPSLRGGCPGAAPRCCEEEEPPALSPEVSRGWERHQGCPVPGRAERTHCGHRAPRPSLLSLSVRLAQPFKTKSPQPARPGPAGLVLVRGLELATLPETRHVLEGPALAGPGPHAWGPRFGARPSSQPAHVL